MAEFVDVTDANMPDWCNMRQCPECGEGPMRAEHAHYRCEYCHFRGACCW